MALFHKALWQGPVPNKTPNGIQRPLMGLVLHIEQGSEASANAWFHNIKAQASAHFGNPKTGTLDQWVDTNDMAWAEMAGNPKWISVEHEGFSGEMLTPSQLENDAQLLAWLHQTEGIPLVITDDPSKPGLGWHGMGGDNWGGHIHCPGDPIKAQRGAIIARAKAILGIQDPAPTAPSKPPVVPSKPVKPTLALGAKGFPVSQLQQALNLKGYKLMSDGVFGAQTELAVKDFQAKHGLGVDGIVGPATWKALSA